MSALGSLVVKLALDYAEYTKGLDKSSQEALKFAQNSQKSFDKASEATTAFFSGVAKGAAGAIATYFGLSAAIGAVNKSIDELASLDDMSQKTGASVESLSRLQQVAKMTGVEFGNVDSAIVKLSNGLGGLDDENSKAHVGLERLGISSKDAAGNLRDPAELVIEIAKRMQGYGDGMDKAALANQLFGKSGADLIPYLNDVNENIDKFKGVSTEAAQKASELQDRFGELRVHSENLSMQFATAMLPAVNGITKAIVETYNESGKLEAAWVGLGGVAAFLFTDEFDSETVKLKKLTEEIDRAKLAKERLQANPILGFVLNADAKQFDQVIADATAKIEGIKTLAINQSKAEEEAAKEKAEKKKKEGELAAEFLASQKRKEEAEAEAKRRSDRAKSEAESHFKAQEKFIQGLEKEAATFNKSVVEIKLYEAAKLGLKGSRLEHVKTLVTETEAQRKLKEEMEESKEANLKYFESITQKTDSINQQVAAQNKLNSVIVLSAAEQSLLEVQEIEMQAVLQDTIALIEAEANAGSSLGAAHRDQAAALRELAKAKREGMNKTQVNEAANKSKSEIDSAKKWLDDFLDPSKAQSFGDALVGSFANAGNALQKLSVSLQEYGRSEAEIAKARENAEKIRTSDPLKYASDLAKINERSARSQIQSYASMAGAAKGFFSEGTRGYKALEAAENTFRLVQLASDLQKGLSAAAVGIATQAQGDPYSAWPRMAAMAAGMAALGFAVGGFGGGGGGGKSAADVQKEQGTGSVFGDASAKSDSIMKSIDAMSKNSDRLLPVNQSMLAALNSIESNMMGFTNLVVRDQGVISGKNFGVQEGTISRSSVSWAAAIISTGMFAPITKLLGNLWGKTTQNVVDSGVQFGGNLNDLSGGKGFNQYASVNTTSSSWFGLKKNTSNSVQTQALSQELSSQMGLIFGSMRDSLKQANNLLGGDAKEIEATLNNLSLSTQNISLKGLSGDALTQALNGVISRSLDEMAAAAFPQYDKFRTVGEGYAETVLRVATTFDSTNQIFKLLGLSVYGAGQAGVSAAMKLSDLMGGMESMQSISSSYFQNFYGDSERLAAQTSLVRAEFKKAGLVMPETRQALRGMVEVARAMGDDATYAKLLRLSSAFADVVPAGADFSKTIDDRRNDLSEAYRREADVLGATIDKMGAFSKSMLSFKDSLLLGDLSTLNPMDKYAESGRQSDRLYASAMAGDANAQASWQSAATAFLSQSRVVNASSSVYSADNAKIQSQADQMSNWASSKVVTAQDQLATLNKQVDGLITVNKTVQTVTDAVNALRKEVEALKKQQQEETKVVVATNVQVNQDTKTAIEKVEFVVDRRDFERARNGVNIE